MRNIPIIHSQLSPPPIRDRFIQRSQLNNKLRRISDYPLTLLYAGAGYGKSTALSLFANNSKETVCWYSISQNDDDLFPFIAKLTESIRQYHAGFGDAVQQELIRIDNYVTDEEIYRLATFFINDVLTQKEKITLILDDFHYVMNAAEIEKWLSYLLEYIPSNLHIIVSSRKKPHWKLLPKLRGQGELLELTQYDLVFTPAEMAYILEEVYAANVSEEEIAKIYRLTEGWAIAFNMLAQQIDGKDSIASILRNQKKSLKDFFAYLATEVLSKQSLITQQFLMQSSILHELTPEICNQVLEISGSEDILSGLVEQNLFIEEGEGSVYQYHALFQTFLENLFKQKYQKEFKLLHKRAAGFYKKAADIEAALYHYRKIDNSEAISSLLHEHGLKMLQSGRLQALYDLLIDVAPNYKQQYPVLYFYQGEIERYRSLYEQAEASYDALIASISGDDLNRNYFLSLALEGKARIYLDTIQPDRAERFVSQAIQLREDTNATPEEMTELYLLMSENLLNAGKAEKAQAWFDRANRLELPLENSNLQARILLRTGRLQKAKDLLLKNHSGGELAEDKHLAQAHRETDILLSFISALTGEAENSKVLASSGIQLGLKIQSPFVEACGWMRMGHAVHLLDQYDSGLAIQCYETSLAIMEKINVSRGKAEPYMGLSILYGKKGMYNQAIENAKKALKETDKVSDRWLSGLIRLGYAITEVYHSHYDKAKKLLKQVRDELKICGDQYSLTVVAFWHAYIAYLEKNDERFIDEMTYFLNKAHAEEYAFFLKRRTIFGPIDMQNIIPILLKAKTLQIEPQFTMRIINELGLDENVKNHPGYTLRIRSLGQFRVWLGQDREVQDWQRGKAKELFELFITCRKQLVQKEEIFQLLWPDLDEEAANKNFKVALNALYKAVEPERKARQDAFFIIRDGSAYQLNPEAGVELDSVQFETLIEQGLEATENHRSQELLEKGLRLYQADYLADLQYTSWSEPERKRLQQIFLRGAERLAQVYVRLGEFNLCIDWCERILEKDNTWEEAYRLIMYCFYQNNNRPQAMKWYDTCCTVLGEELGIAPMEPTQEMYEMIIEAEELEAY